MNGFNLKTKCRIRLYQEYNIAFIAHMIKVNRHIRIDILIQEHYAHLKVKIMLINISAYLTCLQDTFSLPISSFSQSTEINWLLILCQVLRMQRRITSALAHRGCPTASSRADTEQLSGSVVPTE